MQKLSAFLIVAVRAILLGFIANLALDHAALAQGIPAGAATCTATPGKMTACNIPCPLTGGSIGVVASMKGRGFLHGSVSCSDLKHWISCTASATFFADDNCEASGKFTTYSYSPEKPPPVPYLQCEASDGARSGIFFYVGPPTSTTVTCWLK